MGHARTFSSSTGGGWRSRTSPCVVPAGPCSIPRVVPRLCTQRPGALHTLSPRYPQAVFGVERPSDLALPLVRMQVDSSGRWSCQTLLICCPTEGRPEVREESCVSIAELDVSSYSGP